MIKNKKQFLNESNKVNCHPEERSELRILPVIDDSQERWSDSEHTCLVNDSTAGRFIMPKNTEGWGEGRHWQKTLQTAAISLALSFFIAAPVCAADTPPVPTLDRLNQEGATIPDTDPAQPYPESAYTLTEIPNADPNNLPQNAITLYEKQEVIKYYDPTTGEEVSSDALQEGVDYKQVTTIETTPKYYTVSLRQTQYGDPNGTTTLTYGWEKNAEGELEFKSNPPTPVGQTITYKYNTDSFTQKVEGQTIDNPTVTDPEDTSSIKPYIFNSGVGLNNPEGRTQSIDNVLYKDNKVTGTLESTTWNNKYAQVSGGAVNNAGELTSITGAFINNGVEANVIETEDGYAFNYAYGGALYNSGKIGDINADFIGNYA